MLYWEVVEVFGLLVGWVLCKIVLKMVMFGIVIGMLVVLVLVIGEMVLLLYMVGWLNLLLIG